MESLTTLLSDLPAWVLPVLLAPFIGSFLGVLIVRLPDERPIAVARSVCDHCGHALAPRDLVPIVSYAVRRGRCRDCGALLGWTLLSAAWIDLRCMILPDVLTLPLLAAGLVVTAFTDPDDMPDHALAAAAGYALLFAVAWSYRRLRGRDGLGLGDAKLLAALGAWLGLADLPIVLLAASCLGLLAAGAASLAGRRMTAATAIPFGPFLAAAGWLAWLYVDRLADWLAG